MGDVLHLPSTTTIHVLTEGPTTLINGGCGSILHLQMCTSIGVGLYEGDKRDSKKWTNPC